MPKTVSKASTTFYFASSMDIFAPDSTDSEVTPWDWMPQGTISPNGDKSLLQLRAIPWIDTHLDTLIPIAATFLSRIQTPVLTDERCPSNPNELQTRMIVCSRSRSHL